MELAIEASGSAPEQSPFHMGDWYVDPAACRVQCNGEVVKLEPKVMQVLTILASRPGQVVTRAALEANVWAGTIVSYDALTNSMLKLRRALKDSSRHPRIIETIPKKGYRLVAPVQPIDRTTEAQRAAPGASALAGPAKDSRPRLVLIVATMGVVVLVGALLWFDPLKTTENTVQTAPSQTSIAVLPFVNLGENPDEDYFVDGMTDDLITELAVHSDLMVIARDSTFFYKDEPQDVRQIATNLNVRFVVQGSVRRMGDQVRINAQVIDVESGKHLWAERYDGELGDVFGIQDEITRDIADALAVRTTVGERQDLGPPRTDIPQAYDNFLYGRHHFYFYANKDENQKARSFFLKAIEFDPEFAMAYAMLAWTYVFDAMNGWTEVRENSLRRAQELATKAIELEKALPVAYFVRGLSYREAGEYVKALVEAERAIEYDPSYANAHVLLATLLYYAGRPKEGLERVQKAIQLNPHHPFNYSFHLGQAYFILRRYNDAIDAFSEGLASNSASERLYVWLTASLAQAGQLDEAEWEAEQILGLNPDFSLKQIEASFPFKDPADLERFLHGLKKAGLPE